MDLSPRKTAASLPSSVEPSSIARRWTYDVYLSFRGPDTGWGITTDIYNQLQERRITTVTVDPDPNPEKNHKRDDISRALRRAVEESRCAIVVLSENYAHSTWCLEELTKICECMEENNRIFPLFYNVEPSDVRSQRGSFAEAFAKQEYELEKVRQWRAALTKVGSLSGWHTRDYKSERDLVEAIMKFVWSKVQQRVVEINTGGFEVFEATRQAMDEVMNALNDDKVTAVGVYGMGGVGKTIMVEHVCQQAQNNGLFDHVIMVVVTQSPDLRKIQGMLADQLGVGLEETTLRKIQGTLADQFGTFADQFGIKLEESTQSSRAARLSKEIMRRNKILIILDDIWERIDLLRIGIPSYKELQNCNSKVLLTTRIRNVCHIMRCQENSRHVDLRKIQGMLADQLGVGLEETTLRKIQGTLADQFGTFADQFGIKLEESTQSSRAARLSKEIMRRNKILIILDDIWERIDLLRIGIPSYKELQNCNSKVLLTTRIRNVCHIMRCQENITLSTLSEENSWTLFVRNAGRFSESTKFEDVARKVARECAGLPIAVIKVAGALGNKFLAEWKEAAQRLEKSQTANPDHGEDAFRCIKLSYDYLKDEDSKSCFLLCCLFPEDYDIPIEDLFKYAIGKGLFRHAKTIEEASGTADSVVRYLKDSSLLLDSEKKGCVRMHDVIRDTALNIAKSEDGHGFLVKAGCGLQDWPRQLHEGYSAVSLMENDISKLPEEELVCPKLKILLLQGNNHLEEIPEAFFQSSNALRVLDLSHTSITSLPQSFSLLTNLQALYFESCPMIDFSNLGTLKKLEILSMRGNAIKELSKEIGNLTNLRMLDITGGLFGKIPPKVISELHRLEELYMDCGFWEWGSKVEEEGEETIGFHEVTGLLYLNILKICMSDAKCIPKKVEFNPDWVYFDICISRDKSTKNIVRDLSNQVPEYGCNSRSLILDTTISNLPDWFVNVVTKNTEKLYYIKNQDLNNILVEYHHGRLHSLKHLSVIGPNDALKELMNGITWLPSTPVFENLEELHIERVDCLKELCVGELPAGSLVNLKLLKVHYCPNLGNVLLPTTLLKSLPNLENLICKDIPRMKYVFGSEGSEQQSRLREMTFFNLSAVRSICNGPAPQAMFQNLKSLFIYRCNFLGGLFSFDAAQFLFQLEDLFVDKCPLLERLIEVSKETVSDKKTVLPKLKNLGLEKLPMLYSGSGTIDIECPSLKHLSVKECPQFSAFASDFQSRNEVQLNDKLYYFGLIRKSTERELVEAIAESVYCKVEPIEMNMGDFEAFEATEQATMEIEPTMPKSTKDFETVGATTQATIGNSEPAQWKHDVFLSFRGEDTRKGFLSHLYHELQNTKVIRTFKDDEQLEKGKDISQSLLTAIEESRFAIIVLSENYASSAWCLDELTKIFQCMEGKDTVLPIFYHVDPSDIRYQKGQFEVAFTKHESKARYDTEKVKQWRADLTKVGNLSGWDSKNHKSERELVEDIVKFVLKKVPQAPRGDFEEFESTTEAMDEVKKMLKGDKITVIGVYGRGGVGKTAMVKHVSAQAQRIGLFDHVVMAVISRNPDLQKIQGALVNQLGMELVEDEEIERASRLKERIMGGKRILIILDDIWEVINLSSIGIPSYDELQRCNSKVLFTTRIRNLCHSMGCQAHIPLNVLSEEDSLKLFMKKLRKPFHESTISYDEERNIIRECAGLPNVLEEAARALGHKYVEEWNEAVSKAFGDNDNELQKAAQKLNASQLVHTKDKTDTFKRIELSYHTLRFNDAKSLFLLCCMFPEGYDIPVEELLKYGIGKGLLQYSDTLQEARDRADSMVAHLKASGLLLDGKKGCIRMHCDIRNVAMSIALSEEGNAFFVKAGCELKDWPMDAHEGYSAISLMRNKLSKVPESLVCSELQILLLQSNAGICDIPKTFFQCPNALRVFDLSYTSISVLPSSFNLLTNLQALYLDCCNKITDISVLGKLKKVEILSLKKFPHKELPKEIGNLTSLRMLDVTGGCVHKIPSKVLSRLYRLEELYMKCEFGDWGSKVEEAVGQTNADFDEIISLFRLNILKVYISDPACLPKEIRYFEPTWVKFDICISRDLSSEMMLAPDDQPSRTLTLDRTINGLSDWFINVVTQKAEKLEYRECKGLNNILKEYEHGRLHGLKHLSVIGCHENLEELINATTWDPSIPVFESLEEMHLLHLQRLKELCVGELPLGSLCNLKLLKVQTCCNLVNALLPPKLLQRLINLETVFCVNMEHMKYVFASEGLELGTILLTKLSEMRLCALFELISIWNGPAPHAIFGNLKVLAVCKCTKLKNLFPSDVARSLVQLEDLSVERCPNLGRVIEACNSLKKIYLFPELKKLALINLPELTWFCTENGTVHTECPLLEYLYVDECPQFVNSASASVKINDQQHLNSLAKRWEDMYKL